MLVLDASAIIHGWDNYPIGQFPGLWNWIASRISAEELQICSVALTEVEQKTPDCAQWLKDQSIQKIQIGNRELQAAGALQNALGISNDQYHPKGVDENDLFIVAVAMTQGAGLISNEAKQANLPVNMKQYKIPAVCALGIANVRCLDFLDFLKQAGVVFG